MRTADLVDCSSATGGQQGRERGFRKADKPFKRSIGEDYKPFSRSSVIERTKRVKGEEVGGRGKVMHNRPFRPSSTAILLPKRRLKHNVRRPIPHIKQMGLTTILSLPLWSG